MCLFLFSFSLRSFDFLRSSRYALLELLESMQGGTLEPEVAFLSISQDNYYVEPPFEPRVFDGDGFDQWKEIITNLFLGYYPDLWHLVVDGYTHPVNRAGVKLETSEMNEVQKKEYNNHRKARMILLRAISYNEYAKITDRDSAKSIFDSLKMTHEGNEYVKEAKAQALIQKYEVFKMEENESIDEMFSRFQVLVAGLKVLDKGYYTIPYHVRKIMRSLPRKWMPIVTIFKEAKDLNKITIEELISSLKSYEIMLQEDEPVKKGKYVALKSKSKAEKKSKALRRGI